jgi:flagellar motor switch protein FliG
MKTNSNLRKAAVLLRSVDAETAATLLAQLTTEEARTLREAMREIGAPEADEQAQVLAEFRRGKPATNEPMERGVELTLSSAGLGSNSMPPIAASKATENRFDFLDGASSKTLASYLAREHAQTIAVVLSHLPPQRAAAVLASLPEKTQADAMERLSNLGDTDSEAIAILEKELAEWVKARTGSAGRHGQRRDSVLSILSAADEKTRDGIVNRLKASNPELAHRLQPAAGLRRDLPSPANNDEYRIVRSMAKRRQVNRQLGPLLSQPPAAPEKATQPAAPPPPKIEFDQLVHIDSRLLAQLLEVANPNLLALALAGSKDEFVERVCEQMPKRVAKAFRRELRRMGPTRLSDVEAAQRAIADLAARQIALRRAGSHKPQPPQLAMSG